MINRKVRDEFKSRDYQMVVEEADEDDTVPKCQFIHRARKKVEYKYAFGQRIPVDYLW